MFRGKHVRLRCCVLASIVLVLAGAQGVGSTADMTLVSEIGAIARAHDVRALHRVANRVALSHSRRVTSMYIVGRHFADPKVDYAFVRDFPTDIESITAMYALTPTVIGRHGTYAFDQLAIVAERGESAAVEKLIKVVSNADGAAGEFAAERLSVVTRERPSTVLSVMSKLPKSTLDRVVQNPLPWCDSARKLQAVVPQTRSMKQLQARIQVSSRRC